MTKFIAILSAIAIALLGLFANITAQPPVEVETTEDVEEIFEMTGTILEIAPDHYLIENTDGQQVQVNIYDETIVEGETPAVGALIHVLYNGMMTRSLPPQINALRIGCYARTGAIVELTENGFTLDDGMEIIQVNATAEQLVGLEPGSQVTVYFNGAMTMSLPAQIGAELIVPHAAE